MENSFFVQCHSCILCQELNVDLATFLCNVELDNIFKLACSDETSFELACSDETTFELACSGKTSKLACSDEIPFELTCSLLFLRFKTFQEEFFEKQPVVYYFSTLLKSPTKAIA